MNQLIGLFFDNWQIICLVFVGTNGISNQSLGVLAKKHIVNEINADDSMNRYTDYPMIGKHPATLTVMQAIADAAQTDGHVLITGETGTGKELIANAIQQQGRRRQQAYIQINCAAVHPALMEFELFGYWPGAFPEAKQYKPGLLEELSAGTLLLDEIESLPLSIQFKLLRFIEQGDYQPCGGQDYQSSNVRLLAVSNANLKRRVEQKTFCPGLYYRLNTIQLHAPALRKRKTDIPMLIGYYLGIMAKQHVAPCPSLARETLDFLMNYPWPGNIRELRNVCENLVVRRLSGKVYPEHLPINLDISSVSFPSDLMPSQTNDLARVTLQAVPIG